MKNKVFIPALLLPPIFLAGCARVKPGVAFAGVQRRVAARAGQNPQWMRDAAAEAEAERQVRSLLQGELTLDAALRIALINNRSLQATFEEIGISAGDLVQAGLLRNPQISASVRFPDRPPSATNTEFGIADDLLDLIIMPLKKKIAAEQLEQTELRVSHEVLELITQVRVAFYTVQAHEQLIERLKTIVTANAAASELASEQRKAGNINELDLLNQQTLYSQSKLDLAQAQLQDRLEREKLTRLLGLSGVNAAWKVSSHLPPLPADEFSDSELTALALSQRLDLALAGRQVALAERALSLKRKTRFFPAGVDLEFSAEKDSDRQWVRGPRLALALPIFDQGQGQIARLEAEYRQAQRRREALAVQVESEVREANAMLAASRAAALEYQNVLLPGRARILVLNLLQYNYMLKGPYDLLLAKQQQAQAEHAYIDALRDYWTARSQLERAVGGKLVHAAEAVPPDVNAPKVPEKTNGMAGHQEMKMEMKEQHQGEGK